MSNIFSQMIINELCIETNMAFYFCIFLDPSSAIWVRTRASVETSRNLGTNSIRIIIIISIQNIRKHQVFNRLCEKLLFSLIPEDLDQQFRPISLSTFSSHDLLKGTDFPHSIMMDFEHQLSHVKLQIIDQGYWCLKQLYELIDKKSMADATSLTHFLHRAFSGE